MAAKSATMKTQDQNTCLALRLDAEEATLWWWLGFEDDSQNQRGAELEQILRINDAIVTYITYYTLQQHGALRAHTHTNSLTLQAKAERAGASPCTRAHLLSIHSVWGEVGQGVAGSKHGKQEEEDMESDTDLATVQKGPRY